VELSVKIPGGKKLVYTGISMPLTALNELKQKDCPFCKALGEIVEKHNGLWSPEAERYLLANAPAI